MSSLPILLYLSAVLVVGLVFSYKRDKSAEDYFYGGKTAGPMTFGSSLVLSNLLRYQVVLFPLVALRSFWIAAAVSILVVVLSYRVRPSSARAVADTVFWGNRRSDWFVIGLVFISSITIQIAGTMALANIIFKNAPVPDYSTTVLMMIVFAGIYAIVGGFSAVAHAQVFQLVVFFGGLIGLALLNSVPGPGILTQSFSPATSVSITGAILGLPVVSLWIWHYDRFSLQQVRSSRDSVAMDKGLLIAGGIAVATFAIVLVAGNVSEGVPPSPAAHILSLVCVAALMASFAASFTSASELMSVAFFRHLKPGSSEQKLVLVGRLTTAAVIGFTIIMIPMVQSLGGRLIDMFVMVQACLFPPITAIYVGRYLFRPATSMGVFPALVVGEIAGILRVGIHVWGADQLPLGPAFSWLLSMDFFLFAFCLFGFTLVVLYGAGVLATLRLRAANGST
jgi:solute:Na+ symporter, SSS family